jgi:RHS repeat-associated protein
MGDASDSYVAYKYLTTGRIVEEACAAPGARLSCHPECDNSFSALDRFGRVVDQKWYDHGASEVRDRYRYGYDRAGNRLYRENTTTSGKDEFYGYDAINRLIAFDRGDLNAGKTAISGTPVREEDWTLDPLGNWPGYVQKTSGTTDLDQSRTHNKVNEITAIAATTGTDWADPVHDRAGNMTTIPKPASPADPLSCQYDAWNRLVVVMDGQTLVGQYQYDGLNRRIRGYADTLETHVHYFYNSGWQVLETRETGTPSAPPETVQPKHQYAWSLRYIDAPILRDENTGGDGLCDDERLYYLGDANFNVTTLVNGDGDAVEHYVYEPYGQVTFYDEQWISATASTYRNTCLYTGREYDFETGLYHYRNRRYDPGLGVFLSRDPIAYYSSDLNLLRYVVNGPVTTTDPAGLWRVTRAGAWKAVASTTMDGDTIRDLAGLIQLESRDWKKWLTLSQSQYKVVRGGKVSAASLTVHTRLCANQVVEVPNTILSFWFGDLSGLGKFMVLWGVDNNRLRWLGFSVVTYDNDDRRSRGAYHGVLNVFESHFSTKRLHGIFVTGHGVPTGFGAGEGPLGPYNFGPDVWVDYQNVSSIATFYKLGAAIMHVCYGGTNNVGQTNACDLVSSSGICYGVDRVFIPVWDAASDIRKHWTGGRQATRQFRMNLLR